jgi:hypothetical protein
MGVFLSYINVTYNIVSCKYVSRKDVRKASEQSSEEDESGQSTKKTNSRWDSVTERKTPPLALT